MAGYLNIDHISARDLRLMRLCLETAANAHDDPDVALDAVNELVRTSDGPRHLAVIWSQALVFATASATDGPVDALLALLCHTLRAAEDVKFEVEFEDGLDHQMCHGEPGGGPDPDCRYCDPKEDA